MPIYISLRPAYREKVIGPHMTIARIMAGSPQRPYRLKPSFIAKCAREHRLVLSDIQAPPLPWTGSCPVILLFKIRDFANIWMTLTLGRCMEQVPSRENLALSGNKEDASAFSETSTNTVGTPYAVVHYHLDKQCPNIQSVDGSHSCQCHHLGFAGAECRRRYDGEIFDTSLVGNSVRVTCSILFRPARPLLDRAVSTLEIDFIDGIEGGNSQRHLARLGIAAGTVQSHHVR